jgi:hypothetical protein
MDVDERREVTLSHDDTRSGLIKSGKLKIDTTYTTFKVECEPLLRNLLENVQNSYNRHYAPPGHRQNVQNSYNRHYAPPGHRQGQQEGSWDLGDSRSGYPGLFV